MEETKSWTKQKLLSFFLKTAVKQIRSNLKIQISFQWLTLINETQSQTQPKMTSSVQIGVALTFYFDVLCSAEFVEEGRFRQNF